ncbi:MAG: gliding motility lipoprotein GldH, partial [Bacteroidales bacterium]|nr:gliding motility lipoprotein GldH [Bacteroidales bacterium]
KNILLAFTTTLILLISACNREHYLFTKHVPLQDETWTVDNQIPFSFAITDTQTICTIGLNIRYTHTYPMQNMYVFLHTIFPNGMRTHDTISVELFSPEGDPLGKGRRVREIQKDFGRVQFPLSGEYTMTVEQAMRTDTLQGVVSVGLYIVKPLNISNNEQ